MYRELPRADSDVMISASNSFPPLPFPPPPLSLSLIYVVLATVSAENPRKIENCDKGALGREINRGRARTC